MSNPSCKPIKVGLDPSLAPWSAEVKYVFRTLLRIAGYPYEFTWSDGSANGKAVDIYYGLSAASATAPVSIAACGIDLTERARLAPASMREQGGVAFLDFAGESNGAFHFDNGSLRFSNDIISASYWLLAGVPESEYPRDRWDNLHLKGSFFLENSLAPRPLVSMYGSMLRKQLQQTGRDPLALPWTTTQASAAFALSHDVDYPQIIRWIECLRLFRKRGLKGLGSISGVLRGTNHFWKFSDWVEFEKRLGVRPSFYFMARQGSLFQFAMGTPDGFYDVRAPEFRELFRYLKDEDCEIGLHASYHAYRSVEQLRREKEVLEEAAGVT
ncbi:MAG TPA: hypothetical protein VFQ92_07545, partial [Blastocatellia bacterium]|nr:hypothetical protein [Blastocatellia bacterium]